MNRGYWHRVMAILALLILATAQSVGAEPKQDHGQRESARHPTSAAPRLAGNENLAPNSCVGAEQGNLTCDAITAKAAYDQARDADWQTRIGTVGVVGVVLSLIFSALATKAAFSAVSKSEANLNETKAMNAAMVRPHIAIESASIEFEAPSYNPKIILITRNAGSFPAHDWEWQPLLKYRVGTGEEKKSPLRSWGHRGVAGVDLLPGDHGSRIPVTLTFPLSPAEQVAITNQELKDGLHVDLTVFSRCYDTFGNPVDEKNHFHVVAFYLFQLLAAGQSNFTLERVPPGTRIEGQEDKVPTGGAA